MVRGAPTAVRVVRECHFVPVLIIQVCFAVAPPLLAAHGKNGLTGEISCITVRALPRWTGYNEAWLSAFVVDARRRIVSLFGARGSFRLVDLRTGLVLLRDFEYVIKK